MTTNTYWKRNSLQKNAAKIKKEKLSEKKGTTLKKEKSNMKADKLNLVCAEDKVSKKFNKNERTNAVASMTVGAGRYIEGDINLKGYKDSKK